jgi:hypothetical protein
MNASMAVGTKGDHERGVTEAPDNYYVCSCGQAGEFLDLIKQFEHGDEARAFAEEIDLASEQVADHDPLRALR